MNATEVASLLVLASSAALIGLACGLAYFHALRKTIDLFTAGRGWLWPLGLTLARILAAIVVLTLLARLGALALLAGFAGFLLAKMIATRSGHRA